MATIEKIRVDVPEDTVAFFNADITLDDGRKAEAGGWIYGPGMVMGDCDSVTHDRAQHRIVLVPYESGEMGYCSDGLLDDAEALDEVRQLCRSDEMYDQVGRCSWLRSRP